MPEGNVETLERIYAGWRQGDFTVGVEAFADDATMVIDDELPDRGVYEGLAGIRDYTRQFLSAWESITIAPESFRGGGDAIVVTVNQNGVGRDSGAAVGLSYFHVWTFRDGKVIKLQSILREEDALKAAGLEG